MTPHFSVSPFSLVGSIMNECQEFEKVVKVQWGLKLNAPRLTIDTEQVTAAVNIMNVEYNSASMSNEKILLPFSRVWFTCLLFKGYLSENRIYIKKMRPVFPYFSVFCWDGIKNTLKFSWSGISHGSLNQVP